MSYFVKYENLTIYDLLFIGIVSGLLILIIVFLFKKIIQGVMKFIFTVIKPKIHTVKEKRGYRNRLKNDELTIYDILILEKVVADGKPSKLESEAYKRRKEKNVLPELTAEQQQKFEEEMKKSGKELLNRMHRRI
ncbi:hypothetical protein MKY34_19725 [Sporosarcina sp. FSL K6-1522]|uniref:hypothetical protein n=1 Tax=Sporosarcina sp. FSL K6-1522 TaxID=2921554 RepID=UPI00315A8D4E